jgi:hypothetical protein
VVAPEGGRRCPKPSRIYRRHTQRNAIAFVDHVVQKFPFRIHTVRTDRGHEFQALFHWHLADQGIRHVYIKARTPSSTTRSSARTATIRKSSISS